MMKTKMILSALLINCCSLAFAQTTGNKADAKTISGSSGAVASDVFSGNVMRIMDNDRKSNKPKELREHRFKKNAGSLVVEMGSVIIEGYKGDDVVISMMVEPNETDPRAAGLKGINGDGLWDNTGMGFNILQEEGDVTKLRSVLFAKGDSVRIRVPEQLHVIVRGGASLWSFSGNVSVKEMRGALEISNAQGDVLLHNVTGPVTVKTGMGNIEAVFKSPVKGPVSLISSMGFVDIALPLSTKAKLNMIATMGELYAAQAFDIEVITEDVTGGTNQAEAAENASLTAMGLYRANRVSVFDRFGNLASSGVGARVNGTINGGGEDIILRTGQGKIYLRETIK